MNSVDFYGAGYSTLDFFHAACSQGVRSKAPWTVEEVDDLMASFMCGGEL